jgi:phosphomannomutase/phosphoglucomutase
MSLPDNIFREYDIRGIADTDLSDGNVELIGAAFGAHLAKNGVGSISLGGDVRFSTERIRKSVTRGLVRSGISVIDLGVVTTPILYWSLFDLNLDGAVMITGSHNPKDMNGLKLALGKTTIYGDEIQEVLRLARGPLPASPTPGRVSRRSVGDAYVSMLLSRVSLGSRKLRVVADAGNGTAGLFVRQYLEGLGCEVVPLFCDPDGAFPNHHPDPQRRENLATLSETVRRTGADVGLAFDGDADRLGVVDERGDIVWGDILMALYWREILPSHPGTTVLIEVKCSQALEEEARKLGGSPEYCRAGHSLIKARMKEVNALFAGELSGHMFFADEYFGFDDSFYAAGRLLRILSHGRQTLSELLSDIPKYPSTDEVRIDCPDDRKFDVIGRIRDAALRDHDAITVDGVRILYSEGWALARASNTQPVIVARCEGKTREALSAIAADMKRRMLEEGLPSFEWGH